MQISVVICTWNRSKLLARTLESLARQNACPGAAWQVLVVNNSCTDDTDSVVGSFAAKLPVRVLHEPSPGLSNARNRALTEHLGDYIIWTDDDVTVCRDWLCAYLGAFSDWPQHAIFGGPIRPDFEGTPPGWLLSVWPQVEIAYAMRDFGPEPQELSPDPQRLPFGANFAIRADLQRSHPYDPALGRSPQNVFLGGEETAVIRTILSKGWRGRWVPDATVLHWVPKSRQSLRHIRGFCKGQGICAAMSNKFRDCPTLVGMPRWVVRSRFEHELRYRLSRIFARPEYWIGELKLASYSAGVLSFTHHRRLPRRWSSSDFRRG
jgi:glucosyl-dolichyl phosphate glucuronosyltransferase